MRRRRLEAKAKQYQKELVMDEFAVATTAVPPAAPLLPAQACDKQPRLCVFGSERVVAVKTSRVAGGAAGGGRAGRLASLQPEQSILTHRTAS